MALALDNSVDREHRQLEGLSNFDGFRLKQTCCNALPLCITCDNTVNAMSKRNSSQNDLCMLGNLQLRIATGNLPGSIGSAN